MSNFFNKAARCPAFRLMLGFVPQPNLQLRLSVKDDGAGFDVRNIQDPTHEQNLQETSGRGIAIARMNVDQVIYNAKGNKVTLMKDIGKMIRSSH